MAEDIATIGELEICFEAFGKPDDPPLLLVMGLGMQMVGWHQDFCTELAGRGFHVVRFDNRDAGRELTSADELLERHARGFTSSEDTHWSVWTCESFLELCAAAAFPVVGSLDPDDKLGNGFIVVIDAAAARAQHASPSDRVRPEAR